MRRSLEGSKLFIFIFLIIFLEYYSYCAFRSFLKTTGLIKYRWMTILYVILSIIVLVVMFLSPDFDIENWEPAPRNTFIVSALAIFFFKIIIGLFMLLNDIVGLIVAIIKRFTTSKNHSQSSTFYTRSDFFSTLSFYLGFTGLGTILYGQKNKYNYKIFRQELKYDNLPLGMKGFHIVQISDIHSGSFDNPEDILPGIEMINELQPDIILFTGDLVNSQSKEVIDYLPMLSKLKSKMGVYSTLGNHDYGDYYTWDSLEDKENNFQELLDYQKSIGWKMLRNENIKLNHNGAEFYLIGVENWSKSNRFPKYGDLDKAMSGVPIDAFKILMSHDPSHWRAKVLDTNIDLTLSGHTHGFQFGVELPQFRWSPSEYLYPEWAGLYEHEKQKIYVNRGFGFLGYPGRIGIMPEITSIIFT